jgi:2-methylisocitrate lyase-like PEP mutase family enzyme
MSVTQNEKAARFRALHDGPDAFAIPNPWDVGSARILAGLGFKALATSSAASERQPRSNVGPKKEEK